MCMGGGCSSNGPVPVPCAFLAIHLGACSSEHSIASLIVMQGSFNP